MTEYVKYPRTPHVPWSNAITLDDRVLEDMIHFVDREIIVTEKMDGENTTMYPDYIHARSIQGRYHVSRDWIKAFHATIKHHIPEDWRICGENLYAQHSIAYDNLDSYFMGFSVWAGSSCLGWDETIEWFEMLDIGFPNRLWSGVYDPKALNFFTKYVERKSSSMEGFVVRVRDSFEIEHFDVSMAKYVRKNHVQTDKHWMEKKVVPNKLKANLP